MLNRVLILSVMTILLLAQTEVHSAAIESEITQTRMLELFSSEGCSSCPPAEQWVNQLSSQDGLWTEFIPAVFHVTYWNYLGWKDRFSAQAYTNRQRAYVQAWNGKSAYTPCMVLNGKEWRNWYYVHGVPPSDSQEVGVLSVSSTDLKTHTISFSPTAGREGPWRVHAALLGFGISTDVKSGENRGKTLRHDFVVLDFKTEHLFEQGSAFDGSVALDVPKEIDADRYGLAVWVTQGNTMTPIQAAGGYLT